MRGYILPKKLLLGAASAAAQIEGGDVRHSWRDWEDMGRRNHESSFAQACDHWVRWKEDADIMAAMGLETYRLGIEWARIEPGPGCFDREAIRHYREEITYIKDRGIIPCLTLLHFTLPDWFEALGGFRDPANVKYFLRYVGIAVKSFGDLVSDYVTINEPNVFAYMGYAGQGWPPGEESIKAVFRVLSVMAGCHIRAYQRIHRMRRRMGLHDTKVGMALHMRAFAPMNSGSAFQKQSVRISRWYFQDIAARA
ncbi:MAG: family 1 glycosylhydrolase, partial [Lachnospiraceae bacterium]|nr:family 1 glycosylhydrolase [Lachnospiraceae bacterium]